jgi:RNA polymerase sigma factor (sigma-70 family)
LSSEQSDAQLIASCQNGEAWAWDALVERYKSLVYSVALRAGLGQEDAADAFQTVFAVLLENLGRLRDPQGLAAWLITTTKRTSWSIIRKRHREPAVGDTPQTPRTTAWEGTSGGTEWDEERWADRVLVREALNRLGRRCKDLLWMLYFDRSDPSYEQVSHKLSIPLGSIGPTRARCLQKMRRILQALGMAPS